MNQRIFGTGGEPPIRLLSMETTKAQRTLRLVAFYLNLSILPRPMSYKKPTSPSLAKRSRTKATSRTTHGAPLLILLHLSHPAKPIPTSNRPSIHLLIRIPKHGILVNQLLTCLNQKRDKKTETGEWLQIRRPTPYHNMLAISTH